MHVICASVSQQTIFFQALTRLHTLSLFPHSETLHEIEKRPREKHVPLSLQIWPKYIHENLVRLQCESLSPRT